MELFRKISIFLILLFLMSGKAFNQDLLFRKDGRVLTVLIKDFNGKTVTYTVPGDAPERTNYISNTLLDSLRYNNGEKLDFTYASGIKEKPVRHIPGNYLSVEMINQLQGNVNLEYERLPESGKTSFVAGFLINLGSEDYIYWSENTGILEFASYNPHNFFVRLGVNFYPFNYSRVRTGSFRTITGFSLLTGSYRMIDYNSVLPGTDGYYYKTKSVFAADLMWNIRERIYLGDNFQITGGIETSILPFFTFFCPVIAVSIGF